MDKRLLDNLVNKNSNYLMPFFWLSNESHEELLRELDAVEASGAKAFCIESRIHDDFCGERWWSDMGLLLAEAKRRDLKVWLLDDKSFPSGYANGYIRDKYPELRPFLLRETHLDVAGSAMDATMLAEEWLNYAMEESLVCVVAGRRSGVDDEIDGETIIDLSSNLRNGRLYWDVPPGIWRIFFIIKTRKRKYDTDYADYIDMLNPASVRVQIEAVYEPHYKHFGEYFGNTFAGFFSDEPCFGNDSRSYYCKIGKVDMPLPWRDDFLDILPPVNLPGLWYEIGRSRTAKLRYQYMNRVTKLYSENFSRQISDWCHEHHVMHIGHVIEDCNSHTSLGPSGGHFFRNMQYQDMSGVDVVLQQIIPGHLELAHTVPVWGGKAFPEFYHYVLGKLASSQAHITPEMQGRCFCEAFGAYGWAEGVPTMKYIVDLMLVNGINHFVPHAFSSKFPNPDGPPHFFAGGRNAQFAGFSKLMEYTNRLCNLFNGGGHVCSAAILYHAEAEWGGGATMLIDEIAKCLANNQIDYDIIPFDCLADAKTTDGELVINGESYPLLLVPYSESWPQEILDGLQRLSQGGVAVWFLKMDIELDTLPAKFKSDGLYDIDVKGQPTKYLRFYHYQRDESDIYLFFNEDIFSTINCTVAIRQDGEVVEYDAMGNRLLKMNHEQGRISLKLNGGEAKVFVIGKIDEQAAEIAPVIPQRAKMTMDLHYDIHLKERQDDEYKLFRQNAKPFNITGPDGTRNFHGFIKYVADFELTDSQFNFIELGRVGEVARVHINGKDLGLQISSPYRFGLDGCLKTGKNRIVIEVANNLVYIQPDNISRTMMLPPSGLLDPITLY